ncbi:MAG: protein-L-isoaspartate O-methyltransferase [Actinomycetota bacterium]|nr:protein-L-isoaspartate O-methyltransferase [Actinomycetota bacterium]
MDRHGAAMTVDEAMSATPRGGYLPPEQQGYASLDRALPIGFGQTNSQPSTVRAMLTALQVRVGDRVLDVGSGSGWTTVLQARLVGPSGLVVGVELVPELTLRGRAAVQASGMAWARVEQADPDTLGWPPDAPFDRILVSAQGETVPVALLDQLTAEGTMVLPVGGRLLRVRRGVRPEVLGSYVFVPLVTDTGPRPVPGIGP